MVSLCNLSDTITRVGFLEGLNCREAAYLNNLLVGTRKVQRAPQQHVGRNNRKSIRQYQ
jgi:hypothetical protein